MDAIPTFDAQVAIDSLAEQSGMEKTLIKQRVDEKIAKFSGLLTEQGALVLVSKELNAKLPQYDKPVHALKIGELKAGMNNVDVKATVRIVDRIKTYSKSGKDGKYLSTRLGDETGEALYTFWNEQAEDAVQKGLRPGSIVQLNNARVGMFNEKLQISLGYNGGYTIDNTNVPGNRGNDITSTANSSLNSMAEIPVAFASMQVNQFVHAKAHVLDVLPGKGYYVKCGACGGKLQARDAKCSLCGVEGKVDTRLLMSFLLDDGTKPVRAVAFENEVMAAYGKTKEEILGAMDDPAAKEALNTELVGKRVEIHGKAKMGMDNTTVELVINRIIRLPFENE